MIFENISRLLQAYTLALSWFTGYREGWDFTGVGFATLASGADAWSTSVVIPGTAIDDLSTQNPVLYFDEDENTLWVFPTRQPATSKKFQSVDNDPVPSQESMGQLWAANATVDVIAGSVGPWSNPTPFVAINGTWGRNDVIKRLDGSWIFPVYNESLKASGHQVSVTVSRKLRYAITGFVYGFFSLSGANCW